MVGDLRASCRSRSTVTECGHQHEGERSTILDLLQVGPSCLRPVVFITEIRAASSMIAIESPEIEDHQGLCEH